jgi:cbb3-type cytochrome oxidase cytochrome c subunit
MADRGDTHYHIKHLNLWFALTSVLLLATSVWMVFDDASRSWKTHQKEFRALDLELARASLDNEVNAAQAKEGARLQAELEQARSALAARESELAEKREVLRIAKGVSFVKESDSKFAKADFDWLRYVIDEERLHTGNPTFHAEELEAAYELMQSKAYEKELAAAAVAKAEAELNALKAVVTDRERALKIATKDVELVRTRVEKLAPSDKPTQIANVIRDFPGLDFIGPNLKVQKVALKDLTMELNFTKKQRIDMCTTCHMGMERVGLENAEQPYASHPRLDLYLTAKSAHPLNKVGCTICHRGCGEALDFVRADHRPASETQKKEWEAEKHWHKQHHWDYPMLPKGMSEAGCVQCHKDSMELIADDAPKVSKGYQLFEESGCYACHKVEWFPTKRKPGPSLKNLQAKLTPEFIASWIADPKAFRPTTRMPQFFNLENFADGDVIAKSKYGEGRDVKGREWNDSAVAAVAAFLQQRHPRKELPAPPVQGDALRGREEFRLSGCLGCHNTAPYSDTVAGAPVPPLGGDLAHERNGENEMGPNLRGVATKLNANWLYAWIKNPADYWPDTRMPNLRLSDQAAADITAYLLEDPDKVFTDVPQGWKPAVPQASLDVLQEQARWFFTRDGRTALEARFEGKDPQHRWDRLADVQVAVGEKYVLHQGCYSCHEVQGMETMMPIGAELTTWASKTVDKLDFAFIPEIKGKPLGWGIHEIQNYKSYHNNFLEQKLHAPRSYDQQKIKNPTEKLRMPYFGFTDEQVKALTTFVVGLVDDEVQRAKMVSNESQKARDAGLRALRQNNCAACHVLEPGLVTFKAADGNEHTVAAEIRQLEGETLPPRMDRWKEHYAEFIAYMKSEDEEFDPDAVELSLRLLQPAPGLGDTGDSISVLAKDLVRVEPPAGGDFVRVVTDWYMKPLQLDEASGAETSRTPDPDGGVRDVDGKYRKYAEEAYDKVRWTFAPPVLLGEGDKLQREWFFSFLNAPIPLRHQIRARMPSFQYDEGEAGAIADYFAFEAERDWPAHYARKLRLSAKQTEAEFGKAVGLPAATITSIEQGSKVDIQANFHKLRDFGAAQKFADVLPATNPHYELVKRRTPAHLDPILAQDPKHLARAEKLARDATGPYCVQCHYLNGQGPAGGTAQPIQWAPDLKNVRERLREDWVHKWIENPGKVYPGTAMPVNFPADKTSHQALYEGPAAVQIQALLDWLYNLERQDAPSGM